MKTRLKMSYYEFCRIEKVLNKYPILKFMVNLEVVS